MAIRALRLGRADIASDLARMAEPTGSTGARSSLEARGTALDVDVHIERHCCSDGKLHRCLIIAKVMQRGMRANHFDQMSGACWGKLWSPQTPDVANPVAPLQDEGTTAPRGEAESAFTWCG